MLETTSGELEVSEHTPLPWFAWEGPVRWVVFQEQGENPDNVPVADCTGTQERPNSVCGANARFIALACNLHQELLAACETAKEAMKQEFLYQTGQKHRPAQQYPPQGSVDASTHEAIKVINAVLAKAKELN